MNKLHKIILTIITGLIIGVAVMAFTNPSGNPPIGGGTIGVGSNAPANSLYIKSDGNVGIGTTGPGAKLEVAGDIKITGGSPGVGKVLTSDASGLASWQTSAGGGSQLGDLQTKSNNTVYLAATDGFVIVRGPGYSAGVMGYIGSSTSPNTIVAEEHTFTNTIYVAISFPVKKNNYWKVTGASTVYWQSLGL